MEDPKDPVAPNQIRGAWSRAGIVARLGRSLNTALRPFRIRIERIHGDYIPAATAIKAAKKSGVSLEAYTEDLWNESGATANVVDRMAAVGCLENLRDVCEIGPGTGRYLARISASTSPGRYDIYEPAADWARWLTKTYGVNSLPVDGETLSGSEDRSYDLVHAHGVFVYLPFLRTFSYFSEMARTCRPGGHLVFDLFFLDSFDDATIERWLATPDRYPVVLTRDRVLDHFGTRGFRLVTSFDHPLGHGRSTYLILRRDQNGSLEVPSS